MVLFDELEKAHPDVLNLLLQLLDEGALTDAKGRSVSFKQTIIIFTSNIGVEKIKKKSIGFTTNDLKTDDFMVFEEALKQELKSYLSAEFINRIDEIVVFHALKEISVKKIIDKLVTELRSRVNKLDYKLDIHADVTDLIYSIGYSDEYGVRSIKRTITRLLENPLAEYLLINQPEKGKNLSATVHEGRIQIK